MLDLLRYLSEDEFSVKHALVKTLFWNIQAEDNAFILLEGDKGSIASIHSSATQWRHKFLLELTFENGYLNLDGILSGTRSYAPETIKYGLREFEDITWAMGKPQEHTIWFENDHSWQLEIEEFYTSIQGYQKVENGSVDDAVKTLSLVESVYKFNK
jgi:predicted dehydrogenase